MSLCAQGMSDCAPSEAGKFCILEKELCNLVNTFRCNFDKGDKNKILALRTG